MVKKFELKKFEFKKNLKKKFEKKIFFLVRTYVKPNVVFSKIPFTPGGGGGVCPKIKVAQNGVKHGLVLEFLRSDEIFEIWS